MKTASKKKIRTKSYWAMGLVYVPFVMGGDVWQERRFAVQGDPVRILKFSCFYARNTVSKEWGVYHVETGGLLGTGATREAARAKAVENIQTTPDLTEQMEKLGPVGNHPKISALEFWSKDFK